LGRTPSFSLEMIALEARLGAPSVLLTYAFFQRWLILIRFGTIGLIDGTK
jgi:hypothetical protein